MRDDESGIHLRRIRPVLAFDKTLWCLIIVCCQRSELRGRFAPSCAPGSTRFFAVRALLLQTCRSHAFAMPPTCCAFELGMPPVWFDSDTPCRSAGSDDEDPLQRQRQFPKEWSPVLPRPPRARRFRTRRQQPRMPSADVIQFPEFVARLQFLDCRKRLVTPVRQTELPPCHGWAALPS